MAAKEAANGATKSEDEVTNAVEQPVVEERPAPRPVKPTLVKPVNIELDPDKSEDYYQLRMTNKSMQLIEDMLGVNMWNGLGGVSNITAKHVAVMIWACLLWKFPEITIEDIEMLPGMDMANFVYVVTRLDAVVYGSLPEPDPTNDDKESDPNANPSAGSTSGQSDA
jgi:hypothetical protein